MTIEFDEHRDITFLEGGFEIRTTDQYVVEDNARDKVYEGMIEDMPLLKDMDGRNIPQEVWDLLADDFVTIEHNFMKVLRKYTGITFRDEGHDSDDSLIGSCWVDINSVKDVCFLMRNARIHQNPALEAYDMQNELVAVYGDKDKFNTVWDEIYEGTSEYCKGLVDININFFSISNEEYELWEQALEFGKGIKSVFQLVPWENRW